MDDTQPVTVWWLKKDFRLRDNPALTTALAEASKQADRLVVPVFVIEPSAMTASETSAFHVAAWLEAAKSLRQELHTHGGDLLIVRGEVVEVFGRLHEIRPISNIVSHEEVGSLRTYNRDLQFAKWCDENHVAWSEERQTGVFRRLGSRDDRSAKWKQWMGRPPLPIPKPNSLARCRIPKVWCGVVDQPSKRLTLSEFHVSLTSKQKRHRQRVGESAAQQELDDFLGRRGVDYSGGISSPNTAFVSGSRLSVHLAWGTITGRDVYQRLQTQMAELKESNDPDAGKWRRSLNAFRSRLNWRDHFIQRLETEPSMELHSLNRAYDGLPTNPDDRVLQAWCSGVTGLPLVDACIRCAMTTGFLNFRMRCMITSVACHTLRLNWRDIMWPMARWWADYEPGIHLAQLQMQAGVVGINTLRTYNPAKQIADHDPKAKFVKRWVPELRPLTVKQIIAHQVTPDERYIQPIVDWRESTTAMRADYYALRRQPETKALAEKVLKKHGSRKPPSSRRRSISKRAENQTAKSQKPKARQTKAKTKANA